MKITYIAHLLLQSKYAFIFKLFIIFFIYLMFNSDNISFCMMKRPNIVQETTICHEMPVIAEAKDTLIPSHQVIALKKEITDYAGSQIDLLEKIERRNIKIHQLKEKIELLERRVFMLSNEVGELKLQNEERNARLCGYNSDDTYKEPEYHEDPSYYYDNDYYQT